MALPTSVSISSWVQDDATEETPLLSTPQRPATAIASLEEAVAAALTSTTATPPLRPSPVSPHPLTDIGKAKDVVTCEVSPLSTPAVSKVVVESRKGSAGDRSEPLLFHIAVTADAPQSSLCTVTDTHRSPHSSIVTSRVISSNGRVNSLGACCKVSPGTAGPVSHSHNEVGGSSRKSSLEERLSKIWSTSTESNADCEGDNCEGTDPRCRKCGKMIAAVKMEEIKSVSKASQGLKGAISRYNSHTDSFRRGVQQQQQPVILHAPARQNFQSAKENKQKYSQNYSTLLSTCSNNIKKKGSRRQSVDVIYAREPSEPAIDKMKAKRRLSRQTDVSSIELMTLNEGNELEDTQGKDSRFLATTQSDDHPSIATLQVQGENIHLSHCQLSPGGTRIQNLRASSSTESCPRAPWNSLETNLSSSQDIEEKYIINEIRSHPAPQNLDPELDTDLEGGGSDQGERISDDDPDRNAGGTRRRRSSAKMPEDRARGGWGEPLLYQDWSAEAVVLVALLVYIACKVLSFLESLAPRRPGSRK
ncbi:hypothetical protein E2C01_034637 [Portunus trituberculatus]|uniref:Uncharacterized protein n=1 Tax=Portunus trituberculatus TaxID=210409 RepID=A0A5B7F6U6_PORTR|nr:hypothetical protein [Portunus trituberculatus]